MTIPLPTWIMIKYARLWAAYKNSAFDHGQATTVLGDQLTSVALSILKKRGWLAVSLHPADGRKRIYTLKNPEQAIFDLTH